MKKNFILLFFREIGNCYVDWFYFFKGILFTYLQYYKTHFCVFFQVLPTLVLLEPLTFIHFL